MAKRHRAARGLPKRGDVLAQAGKWTITCNDPGYSMLVQYENGEPKFTTHHGAQALAIALMEALRRDPEKQEE